MSLSLSELSSLTGGPEQITAEIAVLMCTDSLEKIAARFVREGDPSMAAAFVATAKVFSANKTEIAEMAVQTVRIMQGETQHG